MKKKNPYSAQEIAYKKMAASGEKSWGEHINQPELDDSFKIFLQECMEKSWFPDGGKAMEFGCGTAPMLRYLQKLGFKGTGVEICETAVQMAREQSEGLGLEFIAADITKDIPVNMESYDLVTDGNCLHCIFMGEDRIRYMENAYSILKKNGVLLIFSMATPIIEEEFLRNVSPSILHENILCSPTRIAEEFENCIYIDDRPYLPIRYMDNWKNILSLVEDNGFRVKFFKVDICPDNELPMSHISIAAQKI